MANLSNTTLSEIAGRLRGAARLLLTTHAKPDGDALGSAAALGSALRALGKTVELRFMPPVPANLAVLTERIDYAVHHGPEDDGGVAEPDLVVVLDTGSRAQVEPLWGWLSGRVNKAIVVDHHLHGDGVGSSRFVDATAAATAEIAAELIDELGVRIEGLIAEALFIGIASDTGWFRFSNTTARTHRLAARLLEAGVDQAALYRATEQTERPEKLELMARALASLRLVAGGRGAVMVLRGTDFAESGAHPDETERLVDLPQMIGSVETVALITEPADGGRTRISFRSKPGDGALDANELAGRFGGGGHARAAGAKLDRPVDQVVQQVIDALESHASQPHG